MNRRLTHGLLLLLAAGQSKSSWRYTDGWTRLGPSALGIGAAPASIFLLTHALKSLPVGTVYAIWTGIGSIGVTLIGILLLGDSASPRRLALIGIILAGMVGLKLIDA